LVGALSDIWGRKFFLLVTVFFTCAPIPLMKINPFWYFAMVSISGIFAVTFSVVFAYVADVTEPEDRSAAYGLVSATFAASLVTSPALGAYIEQMYSEEIVVVVATAIAILDVVFIVVCVPESLPDKCRPIASSRGLTFDQVDPFASMRRIWKDKTILMLCVTVFLSYLPEAGQYSCFFVYLRLVMDFSKEAVAMFIAAVGILSVIAQTGLLTCLMKTLGSKHTIMVGLLFEMLQLMWYGFGSQTWMMWAAGILAAVSSITYPAISAFVSMQTDADKQGLVQGMITGMRGLCNGLGPAMYGLIFSLFHVDLNENTLPESDTEDDLTHRTMPDLFPAGAGSHRAPPPLNVHNTSTYHASQGDHLDHTYYNIDFSSITTIVPGPPFVFGAFLVMLALMVAAFIPEDERVRCNDSSSVGGSSFKGSNLRRHPSLKGNSAVKAGRKKKSDDSDTDDQDDLLDQIKHQRDLPSDKEDSMEDDDYDYMTTVPLMEGVKDRSLL
jgi:predicted MFS family arabinose efflux permease